MVEVEVVLLLPYRQNVVIVGAGRFSRSAKFATSSELLYLLNLLYNMLIECCDEYKLIQLYQKSSVWCFAFSHTSTFELIPAVATAQPGVMVTIRNPAALAQPPLWPATATARCVAMVSRSVRSASSVPENMLNRAVRAS